MFTDLVTNHSSDNGTNDGTRRTSDSTTEGSTGTKATANVAKLGVAHKLFVMGVHNSLIFYAHINTHLRM
jgi:hypothetical protein